MQYLFFFTLLFDNWEFCLKLELIYVLAIFQVDHWFAVVADVARSVLFAVIIAFDIVVHLAMRIVTCRFGLCFRRLVRKPLPFGSVVLLRFAT